MAESFSTFERRMEILSILTNRKKVSIRELSRSFSVSCNAIARDITALGRFAPICSSMGRYGGIYMIKDYISNKTYLSRDEEELIEELSNKLTGRKRLLLKTVIYKFAMPR